MRTARTGRLLLYAVLVLASIFYLAPVYLLVASSIKPFAEAGLEHMWAPPRTLSFAGVSEAWNGNPIVGEPGLANSFLNSVQVVVPGALLSALIGSVNGYVLSRWNSRGANVVLLLLVFSLFVPYQSVLIPLVQVLERLNLFGTVAGLILIHIVYGIPMTTIIMQSHFASIPGELFEAAEMDGASLLGIYRWILFPVAIPGFAIALVWQFVSIWNDFVLAATVATPASRPVTVALNNMAGSFIVQWNVQMAGALIAVAPPLLLFLVLGRLLVRGSMDGTFED